jgi:F-type H+-transporting ATPase subunit delta
MISGALARRYARALIGLAKTPAQRDKFGKDLTGLSNLLKQKDKDNATVLSVLAADRFPLSQRQKLAATFARRVAADPTVVKFVDVVLEKGRIDGLPDIARAYQRMADDAAGRVQAQITSAAPLGMDAVAKIKNALQQATGKQVVTTQSVDPELIGGVAVKLGSFVLDGSVRATLAQLRKELRA